MTKEKGFTLIELLVAIAIVTFIASIGIPKIVQFGSNYKVKSAATDLFQNIKLARAMAIKESRDYLIVFDTKDNRYYIGHDGDGDTSLTTRKSDTFGICKDADKDKYPDNDEYGNYAGYPSCVKVVDLESEYGDDVSLSGPLLANNIPPNAPPDNSGGNINKSITFRGNPPNLTIRSDGSLNKIGTVYFQHASKGYTYGVRAGFMSGKIDLWRWKGDIDHDLEEEWIEVR